MGRSVRARTLPTAVKLVNPLALRSVLYDPLVPLVQTSLPPEAQHVAQLIEAMWRLGPVSRADLRKALLPARLSAAELEAGLAELLRLGVISRTDSGSVFFSNPDALLIGKVAQNASGASVILGEDGVRAMLSDRQARRVLNGDRVLAYVQTSKASRGGRAKLVALLGADSRAILGRFEKARRGGRVIPLDRDQAPPLMISSKDTLDARDGEYVQVEMTEHPFFTDTPSGRVVARVDDPSSARWLIDEVIHRRGFETDWPVTITRDLRELSARAQKLPLDHGRLNLTDLPFVTIDGIHARDFDDAIFCARRGDGFSLDVAIADVAFWVREGSAIDRCAVQRGNSVYLPDRVLPMLPELLSNDLCSLRPNEKRLAFVCRMQIDARGQVRSYQFAEAIICSAARLTYDEVNLRIQNQDQDSGASEDPVQQNLTYLADLTERLYGRRIATGGVDFSFPEVRYDYQPDGWLKSFWAADRSLSTRLVEECMLAANICAAEALSEHFPQAMYRVHEPPDRDAVTELGQVLRLFGIRLAPREAPEAKDFAAALAAMREQPVPYDALQALVLRCMKQARYSSLQLPHFALGFEHYTHFTSPIRRYQIGRAHV